MERKFKSILCALLCLALAFSLSACKKAEHYAQTFQNAELKTLAGELANCHKQRYDRLFNYLNSWQ